MNPKQKAIIVDLDGTLADCEHRRHLIKEKGWEAFYEKMGDDTVNIWCGILVDCVCANEVDVILCTGRPERYRKTTEFWLRFHGIFYDLLLMRPDTLPNGKPDHREDFMVKEEIYKTHIEPHYNVLFCVDDRKQVVDLWRRLGLTCLQCSEGNF